MSEQHHWKCKRLGNQRYRPRMIRRLRLWLHWEHCRHIRYDRKCVDNSQPDGAPQGHKLLDRKHCHQ